MANKNLTTNFLSRLSNARSALPLSSSEATERTTTVCRSRIDMNDTVRTLSVFLLTCTLAVGSLLTICLLVDKHYKARLAKDYAEIEASMKLELEKTRAEHLRWQQRYKPERYEDYPYYVAETRWDAEVRNRLMSHRGQDTL